MLLVITVLNVNLHMTSTWAVATWRSSDHLGTFATHFSVSPRQSSLTENVSEMRTEVNLLICSPGAPSMSEDIVCWNMCVMSFLPRNIRKWGIGFPPVILHMTVVGTYSSNSNRVLSDELSYLETLLVKEMLLTCSKTKDKIIEIWVHKRFYQWEAGLLMQNTCSLLLS